MTTLSVPSMTCNGQRPRLLAVSTDNLPDPRLAVAEPARLAAIESCRLGGHAGDCPLRGQASLLSFVAPMPHRQQGPQRRAADAGHLDSRGVTSRIRSGTTHAHREIL